MVIAQTPSAAECSKLEPAPPSSPTNICKVQGDYITLYNSGTSDKGHSKPKDTIEISNLQIWWTIFLCHKSRIPFLEDNLYIMAGSKVSDSAKFYSTI